MSTFLIKNCRNYRYGMGWMIINAPDIEKAKEIYSYLRRKEIVDFNNEIRPMDVCDRDEKPQNPLIPEELLPVVMEEKTTDNDSKNYDDTMYDQKYTPQDGLFPLANVDIVEITTVYEVGYNE